MVELADTLDLGSSAFSVGVRLPPSAFCPSDNKFFFHIMTVKTSVEDKSSVIKDIKIEIPRSVLNDAISAKSGSIAGRVQLKGFRKGRAPKDYVRSIYGTDIKRDVLNELVREHYKAVIDAEKWNVIGLPDIDVKNLDDATSDVQITVTVGLMPNPEIRDYKGIKAEVEVQRVTSKDIEARLKRMQEGSPTFKDVVSRDVVAIGDTVKFSFKGSVDGKEMSELSQDGATIEVTEGKAPQHLFEGLLGMKVGETKDISLDVPEDVSDKKVAGKAVVYSTTVQGIQEKILPELNDEFAKGIVEYDVDTLDALKKKIEDELTSEFDSANKTAKLIKILDEIAKKTPFEIPQNLIDEEIRSTLYEWGFFRNDKDSARLADVSMFRDKLGKEAETKARNVIILDKIKENEGISVSQEDVENWYDSQAAKFKIDKERMKEYYESHGKGHLVKKIIENDRTIDILISSAKITEVDKVID